MEYKAKKIYSGNYLEIDILPLFEEKQISKYGKKVSLTSDKQKNLNDKNARRYFCQLLNTNFNHNDLHITLTYNDYFMPSSYDEANKIAYNYIRRLKNKYKKQGQELKYVLVTEYTTEESEEQIRIHHHVILNKVFEPKIYADAWANKKTPIGMARCYKLDFNETGIEGLAKYLTKNKGQKKRWSCSQNLKKPYMRERKTRFSKTKISKMVLDVNTKHIWELDNKGYIYTDGKAVFNEVTSCWHFYIRMRKIE